MRSGDKAALVARSQCHLRMGNALAALQDAGDSFDTTDASSITGIFQYGDALFNLGYFEKALIVFYRGRRLRRDVDGFRIGIQKAEEALRTSIALRSATQIEDFDSILPLIKEELDSMNNSKNPLFIIHDW